MKKKLIWLLAGCFLLQLVMPLGALGAAGDNITIASLVTIAKCLNGQITPTPEQIAQYDFDGTGSLNIVDLVRAAQILAGDPIPDVPSSDLTDTQIVELALGEVPGASRENVTKLEREVHNGQLICDVEIIYNGFEYEFEIQASGGRFLKWSCEQITAPAPGEGDIGADQARILALARVPGASPADVISLKADTDNGAKIYEGEIRYDGFHYDFEIAASDGAFLKWSWEVLSPQDAPSAAPVGSPSASPAQTARPTPDITGTPSAPPSSSAQTGLSSEEAKQIVLSYIPGAVAADFTQFNRDTEDGIPVFEGKLTCEGVRYEFQIAAQDGRRIEWSWEKTPQADPTGTDIGPEGARELALAEVPGADAGNITKTETDIENGVNVYEVDIYYQRTEYEFEIVASTGEFCAWSMKSQAASPKPTDMPSASPSASSPAVPAELTREEAQKIVLSYIPGASQANFTEFQKDTENGVAVYEGELYYDGTQYEFTIAASDGSRFAWSWKRTPQAGVAGADIGMAAARRLAVAEVENATDANITKAERDSENGVAIYEICIHYAETEYEFEIVASTGEFCKQSFERRIYQPVPMPTIDASATASPTRRPQSSPTPAVVITPQRAKEIALAQVPGASSINVTKCRLDHKGRIYEVQIRYSGAEYEFEIDAATGAILKQETDQIPASAPAAYITPQQAKQLVLDRVPGASLSDFREFGLDMEKGRDIYQGELYYNGVEYDFKIDLETGQFLEWEAD